MAQHETFDSFEEFWPHYLREHASPLNRRLHVAGTAAALGLAAVALIRRRPALLLAVPVIGYGGAWLGHYFVERNRPATFHSPLWSLKGDLKMLGLAMTGKLDDEVARQAALEPRDDPATRTKRRISQSSA